MSLETIATSTVYTGNGSTSEPYPIPFAFLAAAHIKVLVRDANTLETVLSPGAYTVTRFESGLGSLKTTQEWDSTHEVVISRVTPTTQPIVLEDGALIPAKTLERGLDRLAMVAQETRGITVEQEVSPHGATHLADGNDPVTLSQSQVTGLVSALTTKASAATVSAHLANTANPHGVTKAQLGLGAVDNTADADKPISTAAQTALDAKSDKLLTTDARTGTTETLVLSNAGQRVTMSNAAANTLTVPPHAGVALPVGCQVLVEQLGAGVTTIAGGSGVTIRSRGGLLALAGQYAVLVLIKDAENIWTLTGDLA